jgi:hemolysin activation/secretion protein
LGTALTGSGTYSPGGLTDQNEDLAFATTRFKAKAEYVYGRISIERLTKLPQDFSWILRGSFQAADGNLLASEQFGLGGFSTVRGYEEREANGDEGYWFSSEIRTPPLSFGEAFGSTLKDELQFLGFFDYGVTENRDLLPGEKLKNKLGSVGPGIRFSINPFLSLRFDYGWQLYDTGFNTRYNSRGHLGVMLAY